MTLASIALEDHQKTKYKAASREKDSELLSREMLGEE
jgi:hypothetical protein